MAAKTNIIDEENGYLNRLIDKGKEKRKENSSFKHSGIGIRSLKKVTIGMIISFFASVT